MLGLVRVASFCVFCRCMGAYGKDSLSKGSNVQGSLGVGIVFFRVRCKRR